MAGGVIGEAVITVGADASEVASDVQKQAKNPLSAAGDALGRVISAGLSKGLQGSLQAVVASAGNVLQAGLGRAGEAAGALLRKALGPDLANAIGTSLSKITSGQAALSALGSAGAAVGTKLASALGPVGTQLQNLAAGFINNKAAASAFTGVAGTIGGLVRGSINIASSAVTGFASVSKSAFTGLVSVAQSAWDKISSSAKATFSAIGNAASDALSSSLKLAGASAGAVLGTALTKGFGRLEAIDTATAKLTGLGHSADSIASIMDSATAAVKGTAFGLGDAASAAAQFSAAGVPLDGMQRSLSILASASAVAGSSMGEMTTIFGKVAATGKLNGEVVQQLSERGIPVLSLLSKQLGVTSEDVSKMVSSGEIDFETFQSAMEASLGPAAAAMGQSFSGMLQNVGAALGRFGAAVEAPAFSALKTLFPALISLTDQFTAAAKPLAEVVAGYLEPAISKLAGYLSGISFTATTEGAQSFLAALGPLLPVLGAAAGMLGPLLTDIPVLGKLFSGITGPVGLFVGALAALTLIDPETLMKGFDSIAAALPSVIEKIASAASTMLPDMLGRIATNLPVFIAGIIQLVQAIIPALTIAIPQIVAAFATLVPQLITSLLGAIPMILTAALSLFQSLITAIVTVLPQVIASLVAMLPLIANALITALPQIIAAALALFMGLLDGLVQATPVLIAAVLDLLPQLITTLLGMLPTIIDSALELFLGIVTGLLTAIPDILVALLEMLPQLISTLLGMIPQLIQGAVRLFTGLVEALPIIIPKLIDALIKLGPVLVQTIISLVPQLLQAGVDLIGGLVSGLWQAAGSVGNALLKIAQDAIGGFLSFLGIHSPSKLFDGYGKNIGQGLVNGLDSMQSAVDDALMSLVPPPATFSVNGSNTYGGAPKVPGAGNGATTTAGTSRTSTTTIEAGAFQLSGADPYEVSMLVADRIAGNVGDST